MKRDEAGQLPILIGEGRFSVRYHAILQCQPARVEQPTLLQGAAQKLDRCLMLCTRPCCHLQVLLDLLRAHEDLSTIILVLHQTPAICLSQTQASRHAADALLTATCKGTAQTFLENGGVAVQGSLSDQHAPHELLLPNRDVQCTEVQPMYRHTNGLFDIRAHRKTYLAPQHMLLGVCSSHLSPQWGHCACTRRRVACMVDMFT